MEGSDSDNLTRLAGATQKLTVLIEKRLAHNSAGSENKPAELVSHERLCICFYLCACVCLHACVCLCKYRSMFICAAGMTEVNLSVSFELHPPCFLRVGLSTGLELTWAGLAGQ